MSFVIRFFKRIFSAMGFGSSRKFDVEATTPLLAPAAQTPQPKTVSRIAVQIRSVREHIRSLERRKLEADLDAMVHVDNIRRLENLPGPQNEAKLELERQCLVRSQGRSRSSDALIQGSRKMLDALKAEEKAQQTVKAQQARSAQMP